MTSGTHFHTRFLILITTFARKERERERVVCRDVLFSRNIITDTGPLQFSYSVVGVSFSGVMRH